MLLFFSTLQLRMSCAPFKILTIPCVWGICVTGVDYQAHLPNYIWIMWHTWHAWMIIYYIERSVSGTITIPEKSYQEVPLIRSSRKWFRYTLIVVSSPLSLGGGDPHYLGVIAPNFFILEGGVTFGAQIIIFEAQNPNKSL